MSVDSLTFVTPCPWPISEKRTSGSYYYYSRYRLAIDAPALSYTAEYFVAGDKTTFNFSKLPDIVGTGEKYGVQVGRKEDGK